jgi:lipoate-protein ligase A
MTPSGLAVRLPHGRLTGAIQMATDAALLAWVAAAPGRLVFRTYAWLRPTISLGRREPFPGGWDLARLRADGIDVVRRPTGGDAVFHDDELTFAIAASLAGPHPLSPRGFADAVADALAAAVSATGIEARRVEAAEADPGGPGLACFARAARGEVRAGGYKIAGIASRFARGAALCHASVPIGTRYRDVARYRLDGARDGAMIAVHARSLEEIAGPRIESGTLAERLADAVAGRFRVTFEPAEPAALGIDVAASAWAALALLDGGGPDPARAASGARP